MSKADTMRMMRETYAETWQKAQEVPKLQAGLEEVRNAHNGLCDMISKKFATIEAILNQHQARLVKIDYRGGLGWWRRRRDVRRYEGMKADTELAARKVAAQIEASQRAEAAHLKDSPVPEPTVTGEPTKEGS